MPWEGGEVRGLLRLDQEAGFWLLPLTGPVLCNDSLISCNPPNPALGGCAAQMTWPSPRPCQGWMLAGPSALLMRENGSKDLAPGAERMREEAGRPVWGLRRSLSGLQLVSAS